MLKEKLKMMNGVLENGNYQLGQFAFVERSRTMKAPVGLLSDRTVLRQQDGGASPRQVQVCLPLTMHCRKSPQTVVWGFFICGGWYRMGTASVLPARFSIAFRRKVCFNKKSDTAIRRREKVGAGCSKLRS